MPDRSSTLRHESSLIALQEHGQAVERSTLCGRTRIPRPTHQRQKALDGAQNVACLLETPDFLDIALARIERDPISGEV